MFPEGLGIFVGAGSPGPRETPERSGKNGGTGNPSPTMFPEGLGIFVGAGSPGPRETPERSEKNGGTGNPSPTMFPEGLAAFVGADAHIRPVFIAELSSAIRRAAGVDIFLKSVIIKNISEKL